MQTLPQIQEWLVPRSKPYYGSHYRAMERDYLPVLCESLEQRRLRQPDQTLGDCLDIGPGWGTMMLWLAHRSRSVVGMDFVPKDQFLTEDTLAAMAVKSGRNLFVHRADIFAGPLRRQFDLIVMAQVIPHLKWRPDRAIANVAQMLRTDGTAYFVVLDRERYPHVQPAFASWRNVPEWKVGPPPSEMVVSMYDRLELQDLLATAFHEVAIRGADGSTSLFAECGKPKQFT